MPWSDLGDPNHLIAGEELLTHNYVLVESLALIQRRLGPGVALQVARSARTFDIEWSGKRFTTRR